MARTLIVALVHFVILVSAVPADAQVIGRISVSSTGAEANGSSWVVSGHRIMSADGRYVVFWSEATNLVEDDTNGVQDVFIRDRVSNTTQRVSHQLNDVNRPQVFDLDDAGDYLLGLQHRETEAGLERSHIAAFNPGEDDVQISLDLYDGATGSHEGSMTITVRGGELKQVNNVIEEINRHQDGGVKRLQVTVDQSVFVKGFRVNASGDPVTIDLLPE